METTETTEVLESTPTGTIPPPMTARERCPACGSRSAAFTGPVPVGGER